MSELHLTYPPGSGLVNVIDLATMVGAVQAGGISGLVLDQFRTNQAAPLTSPRTAEPGPGEWNIADTGENLLVENDWLVVDGSVSWGDPSLWLAPALDANAFGAVAMLVQRLGTTTTGPALLLGDDGIGFDPTNEGVGLYFDNYELRMAGTGEKVVVSPERLGSIYYVLAIVRLPGGMNLLAVSGGEYGAYPVATPLFIAPDALTTDVYVGWQSGSGGSRTDWIHAIARESLPSALQSRFGATLIGDDFARADGDLDGSSPTNGNGTWDVWAGSVAITSGRAHPSTSGFCRARIDCGEAPRIVACTITTPSNVSGVEVYVELRDDGENRISVAMDTTQTYVFSSYSSSTLANHPATIPSDSTIRMVVVDLGDRIRVYRDGVLLIDVPTTEGQGATRVGFTTNSQDVFVDDFEAWPEQVMLGGFAHGRHVSEGSGAALFSDAFTDPDGTALDTHDASYTIVDGPFEIHGNEAVLSDGTGNGFALIDAGSNDHEVEAVITLPADNNDGFNCGLVVRYDGQGNYLFARYLNQGAGMSPEIELIESVGGQTEVIAFVNLGASAIPAGSTHTLRVAVRGREVAVYHNDKLVLQSETVVSGGTHCGLGRSGTVNVAGPSWDDLVVRAA